MMLGADPFGPRPHTITLRDSRPTAHGRAAGPLRALVATRPRDRGSGIRAAAVIRSETPLYGAGASVIEAMPAATLSPVLPWKLIGCSEIVLPLPPISALTEPPTPTVAPAVAPP